MPDASDQADELQAEVAALRGKVTLLEAERDGLASQLLKVQKECIALRAERDESEDNLTKILEIIEGLTFGAGARWGVVKPRLLKVIRSTIG